MSGKAPEKLRVVRIWGLTGGIASGKSTVARLLAEQEKIPVLDADQVARELSEPGGAAHDAIVKRFGTADRARLRGMAFSDPRARGDLEAILHPLIRSESSRRLHELAQSSPSGSVVYEAALLVETGRYRDFHGLIVVEAPRDARRARLLARGAAPMASDPAALPLTPELADRILDAQIADEERRKVATHVIENAGSLEELRAKVHQLAAIL